MLKYALLLPRSLRHRARGNNNHKPGSALAFCVDLFHLLLMVDLQGKHNHHPVRRTGKLRFRETEVLAQRQQPEVARLGLQTQEWVALQIASPS